MSPVRFHERVLWRLALAMGTITALAFASMSSSVYFAKVLQGSAHAINRAGALRMETYRVAAYLAQGDARAAQLIDSIEPRLESVRRESGLPAGAQSEMRAAYDALAAEWRSHARPRLLDADLANARAGSAGRVAAGEDPVATVSAFVQNIDAFVQLLEQRAETRVRWLRSMQIATLILTVIVVAVTMYMMHARVLLPLRELLACARRARLGDFSHRTRYQTNDELGQLGRAFNVMAEDLSKIYSDLEAHVRNKTADLERSNRSLELLYEAAVRLNQSPLSQDTMRSLLLDLQAALGVGPTAICMTAADGGRAYLFAGTDDSCATGGASADQETCQGCLASEMPAGGTCGSISCACMGEGVQAFSIRDQNQVYGLLRVGVPAEGLESWQTRLLQAIAAQIAIAVTNSRRSEQSRRLALFEERAVIARELHDSLAQSLSYLKIQTARLDAALQKTSAGETARGVVEELREGVNSAYRQLRELLSTFRLRVDGRGLATALDTTVREFRDRNGIRIELDYNLERCSLSANEEIHVLQVVREALSNVVRHARASWAGVVLAYDPVGNRVTVTIDDDGIGIPPSPLRTNHYGLAIMDERARTLGGEAHVFARTGGGTRVQLMFSPLSGSGPPSASAPASRPSSTVIASAHD